MAKPSHLKLKEQIASITVSLMFWIPLDACWRGEVTANCWAPWANPIPHQSVFYSSPRDSLFPASLNYFQIPISLWAHLYAPVQVIGILAKFITQSIQKQSMLICECINLLAVRFLLICSFPGVGLVSPQSLSIPEHIGSEMCIPFNWLHRWVAFSGAGSRSHDVNCRLESSDWVIDHSPHRGR